jgi:anti-sigma factor RsiW
VSCELTRHYVPGYLDGELDLVRTFDTEAHLKRCSACTQELENLKALRFALQRGSLSYTAPVALRAQIQSSLRESSGARVQESKIKWPSINFWQLAGAFALLALISVSGWQWTTRLRAASSDQQIAAEVFSSHLQSLEGNHLMDVVSTDQHTVKPWFDGKLDFSPPVQDLANDGFPLVGGRLDYVEGREVAALVYQRRKHFINVFVWPGTAGSKPTQTIESKQGYHILRWSGGGFEFWAVSDVAAPDLAEFVHLLETRIASESKWPRWDPCGLEPQTSTVSKGREDVRG